MDKAVFIGCAGVLIAIGSLSGDQHNLMVERAPQLEKQAEKKFDDLNPGDSSVLFHNGLQTSYLNDRN